ncbi:uncharacterized protein N7459_000593 [Penicillium hispanicum]|uniref:uncharacterized protein n=1 Tax=Penicillium hispanicum TaxID=1080232 RepID=UPI00254258F8|nr:uncharacterized protein N7459_000593 [Penicillium hispanicum]KAJ5594385.1 hypothetical protein N7459_000593 [Penicillium hispanicum]
MSSSVKTVAFFGASAGVGHGALKHSLAAGHKCIALCRDPSKLTTIFPPESTPNLTVISGNAHDVEAVSKCLQPEERSGKLVDMVITTIGGRPIMHKMTVDDPNVCRKGAAALLEAIAQLRQKGATGNPQIVAFSTTGLSKFARDYPLLLTPVYTLMLKVPHEDKEIMEETFIQSGLPFTITRASLLTTGETDKPVRVGIEDPKTGIESKAIGYTISREDCGRWLCQNLISKEHPEYMNKILTITN